MNEQAAKNRLTLSEKAIHALAILMTDEDRLRVFEKYRSLHRQRTFERMSFETKIDQGNLYKYLPKSESRKGGHTPGPGITAKMLVALLQTTEFRARQYELVIKAIEPSANKMHIIWKEYHDWVVWLKQQKFL